MKTILVSGATKGIGKAIVYQFAKQGFNVAFCARNQTDVTNQQNDLKNKFPHIEVLAMVADMSRKEEVGNFGKAVIDQFKSVDVLVNNAGVFLPGELLSEAEGMLEKQIETNVYSAYHLTRAIAPTMDGGHIFNVCSTASIKAYPNGGSYCISKFALLGFSKVLREELKPKNVKVTALLPGATLTASWDGVDLPENRFMKADDLAETVWACYQLSPNSVVEEIIMRPQLGDIE